MDARKQTNAPLQAENTPAGDQLTRPQQALGHLFFAFVLAVGLLLLERLLGGGWRSVWSFGSTVLLIWAGLLPVVFIESGDSWTKEKVLGVGAVYGMAIGLVYGIATRSLLPGAFFGLCLGHFIGALLHLGRFRADTMFSQSGIRTGGVVAAAIVALHFAGVMKPTKLIREQSSHGANSVANESAAASEKGRSPSRSFFTQREMTAICKKAEQLRIGATRGEVLALLGAPGMTRDGGKSEFLVWSMDEQAQRFCVLVGIQDDVVFKLQRDAGLVFQQPAMIGLLKKAQTLRLGMTLQEVLRIMGPPSQTSEMVMDWVESFDSVTEEMRMAKKGVLTVTWTSEDSNDRFVMVGVNETGVFNVGCNQPGRGQVYELKR